MKYKIFFITFLCLYTLHISAASAARPDYKAYQSLPLYGHYTPAKYEFLTLFTSQSFGNPGQIKLQELGERFTRNQLCATNPFIAFQTQSFAITIHGSQNVHNKLVPTPWNICWHYWRFGSKNNVSAQVLMGLFEPVGLGAAQDLPFNTLASLLVNPHDQHLSPNNAQFTPQPGREIISFFAAAHASEDNQSALVFTLIINNPVLQQALLEQKITTARSDYQQPFHHWLTLLQNFIPQLTHEEDKRALANAIEILKLSSESFYGRMQPAQPWQAFTPTDALTPEELAWIATSAAPAPNSSQQVASSAQLGATAQSTDELTDEQLAELLAAGVFDFEEPSFAEPPKTSAFPTNPKDALSDEEFFEFLAKQQSKSHPSLPPAPVLPTKVSVLPQAPQRPSQIDLHTLKRDLPRALGTIPADQTTTLDASFFGPTESSAPTYTASPSTGTKVPLPKQRTIENFFELSQELRAWLDKIIFSSENETSIKETLNRRKKSIELKTEINNKTSNIIQYIKNKLKP